MKKIISILLSLVFLTLLFTACGNTNNENNDLQNKDSTINTTESTTEKVNNDGKLNFNYETYRVPMKEIYIDLPSTPYHLVEMGYTKAAFIYDEQCVSITWNELSQAATLEQAQKDNINEFSINVQNQVKIDSLNVKEDETVTINGVEMYRFEGEFNCTRSAGAYTQYAVGYTFIMDGIPCSVIGTVMNKYEEQPSSVIKEVEEKVDAVIKTLRSEL